MYNRMFLRLSKLANAAIKGSVGAMVKASDGSFCVAPLQEYGEGLQC